MKDYKTLKSITVKGLQITVKYYTSKGWELVGFPTITGIKTEEGSEGSYLHKQMMMLNKISEF